MMEPTTLPDVARLALMIFANALWQGALIAIVAWAIQSLFPRANAATRYAVWVLALIAMIATPLLTTISRVSVVAASPPPATVVQAGASHTTARLSPSGTHTPVQPAVQIGRA